MNVISKRGLRKLIEKHPQTETEALDWYRIASAAEWSCLADVRKVFPSADLIGEVLVFNLLHNRYRLIATVFLWRARTVRQGPAHTQGIRPGGMEKMVLNLSPAKYGKLLSATRPKRIETDAEFDHFVEVMEGLSRAITRGDVGPEERALHALLSTLVKEYDDRVYPLPPGDPVKLLRFLMEQRDLRPADLVPIFGARSIVSMALNGKRGLSKTHIRKLAAFFHVSPALFLEA